MGGLFDADRPSMKLWDTGKNIALQVRMYGRKGDLEACGCSRLPRWIRVDAVSCVPSS